MANNNNNALSAAGTENGFNYEAEGINLNQLIANAGRPRNRAAGNGRNNNNSSVSSGSSNNRSNNNFVENNLEEAQREYNNYRWQQEQAVIANMENERYGNELAANQVDPEEVNSNQEGGRKRRKNRKNRKASRKSARKGNAVSRRKTNRRR